MSLALLLLAQAAPMLVDGPDLKLVERAVDKCDRDAMAKIFSAEPQRRRAMVIAVFNEQQAIVAERQALAQRRLDAQTKPAGAPAGPQPAGTMSFDVEAQMLANRQQALDDARMLGNLRDAALDMMRQQYLLSCNSGLAQAGGN